MPDHFPSAVSVEDESAASGAVDSWGGYYCGAPDDGRAVFGGHEEQLNDDAGIYVRQTAVHGGGRWGLLR